MGRRPGSQRGDVPRITEPSSFVMLPHESEDIQITGGTRSLVRRLMALNLEGTLRKGNRSATEMPMGAKIA